MPRLQDSAVRQRGQVQAQIVDALDVAKDGSELLEASTPISSMQALPQQAVVGVEEAQELVVAAAAAAMEAGTDFNSATALELMKAAEEAESAASAPPPASPRRSGAPGPCAKAISSTRCLSAARFQWRRLPAPRLPTRHGWACFNSSGGSQSRRQCRSPTARTFRSGPTTPLASCRSAASLRRAHMTHRSRQTPAAWQAKVDATLAENQRLRDELADAKRSAD